MGHGKGFTEPKARRSLAGGEVLGVAKSCQGWLLAQAFKRAASTPRLLIEGTDVELKHSISMSSLSIVGSFPTTPQHFCTIKARVQGAVLFTSSRSPSFQKVEATIFHMERAHFLLDVVEDASRHEKSSELM